MHELGGQHADSNNRKAFRPEERNPVAESTKRRGEGHGVAEGVQGEDEAAEQAHASKLNFAEVEEAQHEDEGKLYDDDEPKSKDDVTGVQAEHEGSRDGDIQQGACG